MAKDDWSFQSLSGEKGMRIFEKLYSYLSYLFDSIKANYLKIKIDNFQFDGNKCIIVVYYRIGNKKLLNKLPISKMEQEFFAQCMFFDQFRLVKYATLQNILDEFKKVDVHGFDQMKNLIEKEVKRGQLF